MLSAPPIAEGAAPIRVKICGFTEPETLQCAVRAGADYAGFVFCPPSPRAIGAEAAARLASLLPEAVAGVGLFIDPSDEALEAVIARVALDMIQLHGSESPARVAAIRAKYALPVMKAVPIAGKADRDAIRAYSAVADQILCDAAPAGDASGALPGGNGLAFDWRLISHMAWERPWMLAGGLNRDNVTAAIRLTGARQVDVSSGVESSPGKKDCGRIADFIRAAKGL